MWNAGLNEAQARIKLVFVKSLEIPWDNKGNQSWVFIGTTDVEAETPILGPPDAKSPLFGKRPWGLERLKAGEEGDNRGWDGWMALLTQWTWVWASSRRWWRTGKPGVLQSVGSQRVGHNWVTEQWQAPTHVLQREVCRSFLPCLSRKYQINL